MTCSAFAEQGVKGLRDLPRSGKPAKFGAEFRDRVLALLEHAPPPGQSQ
jgi:hypothetical protein